MSTIERLLEQAADRSARAINEAVVNASENTKGLSKEALLAANGISVSDIAGARFVPQSDARIAQGYPASTGDLKPARLQGYQRDFVQAAAHRAARIGYA